MRLKYLTCAGAIVFFSILLSGPKTASALDLIVEHNPTDSSHFSTIQSALNYVSQQTSTVTTFRIMVAADPTPYSGPITPISNVPIIGSETARTFISGGTGTPITISNVTSVTIKNFTIIDSSVGIAISNSSSIRITGNVFQVGMSGTAVQVQNSSSASIINNTFYQNGTAINTNSDILITNNIFSGNGTAISSQVTMNQVTFNDYNNNSSNGNVTLDIHSLPNTSVAAPADPLFVKPEIRDFHLKDGSPCHSYVVGTTITSAGNPSYANAVDSSSFDMGAYGGPDMDTIPFPVQNFVSSVTSTTPPTVHLTWDANLAYQVTGYTIHYGTVASSLTTTIDAGNVTSSDVTTGLSPASAPTGTAGLTDSVASNTLLLSWATGSVIGATGYEVRYEMDGPPTGNTCPYSTIPTSGSPTIDAKNTTSHPLTGLDNDTCYSVIVVPYALATYYFVVTAHYSNPAFESANSNVESQPVGDKAYDIDASNVIHDFPEAITPYPDLPNKGCFIATAAYGHYSAPQVQALREFRDKFLLTTAPGRAFVEWYYRYGPIGAEFITTHPWLKPVVRTALLPAVAGAMFMTGTSLGIKTLILCALGLLIFALLSRKKLLNIHTGGRQ